MSTADRGTALSKVVAHALRHEPWLYELEVDDEGWVPLAQLLAALRRTDRWRDLRREEIVNMVADPGKRRYETDGGRIRALYGHSLPGRIRKQEKVPPDRLFHGTSPAALPAIRETGLRPMGRQYVHLSVDRETAEAVGRRKSADPVVLVIDSAGAHRAGVRFWQGNEKVWLVEWVPHEFLRSGE